MANKDNFLKYEYNNEISSHKEMLCAFCFYPGPHTTAIISLLTMKYEVGAAISFSITMQVYSSISAGKAINVFYNPPSTVLSTTITMETIMVSSYF